MQNSVGIHMLYVKLCKVLDVLYEPYSTHNLLYEIAQVCTIFCAESYKYALRHIQNRRNSTFHTELAIVAHITVSNSGSGIENQHLKVTNRQTTNR